MFFKPHDQSFSKLETSNYSLVLPAISVGNVGQLTVDVLIATTQAEKVGSIYDESLLPVIGNDPFSEADTALSCQLSTCCDVYSVKSKQFMIIQQRASFVKGKRKLFRKKLLEWIKNQQFKVVYLIGSMYAHMRTDQQLTGLQFRYVATDEAKSLVPTFSKWIELEDTADEFGRSEKRFPGSGIFKTLYGDCIEEKIAFVGLLMFCAEGDNSLDAVKMADHVNAWTNVVEEHDKSEVLGLQSKWQVPKSWNLNYGSTFNHHIY